MTKQLDLAELAEEVTDEFIDLKQACKVLKLSERTMRKQVAEDAIPHFRIGVQIRFHLPTLRQWALDQTTGK